MRYVDKRNIREVVYEDADQWGNYTVEYYDHDGYLVEEVFYDDGSSSYTCKGE